MCLLCTVFTARRVTVVVYYITVFMLLVCVAVLQQFSMHTSFTSPIGPQNTSSISIGILTRAWIGVKTDGLEDGKSRQNRGRWKGFVRWKLSAAALGWVGQFCLCLSGAYHKSQQHTEHVLLASVGAENVRLKMREGKSCWAKMQDVRFETKQNLIFLGAAGDGAGSRVRKISLLAHLTWK